MIRLPYRENTTVSLLSLAVFLIPLVFTLWTYDNFQIAKFSFFLIFSGLVLAIWLIQIRKNDPSEQNQEWKFGWFSALLGAFWLWALFATIFSPDKVFSFWGFYSRFTSGLLFFTCWVALIVAMTGSLDRNQWKWLIQILVFDALLISVYGIVQSMGYGFYSGIGDISAIVRPPTFIGNPNFAAMFLAAILPFSLVLFILSNSFREKIYYSLSAFFSVWFLSMVSSRGALLAVFLAAVLFLVLAIKNRSIRLAISTVVLIIFNVFLTFLFQGLARPEIMSTTSTGVVYQTDENITNRWIIWDSAMRGIVKNPLIGFGPGNFILLVQEERDTRLSQPGQAFDDPHNLFLQIGAAGGLPLVGFFLAMFVLVWYQSLKTFFINNDLLSAAVGVSLLSFAVAGSFSPVDVSSWLLLAILFSSTSWITQQKFQRKIFVPRFFMWLGITGGIIVAIFGIGFLVSEHFFYQARQAYLRGDVISSREWINKSKLFDPSPINPLRNVYDKANRLWLSENPAAKAKELSDFSTLHSDYALTYLRKASLLDIVFLRTGQEEYLRQAAASRSQAIVRDPFFSQYYTDIAVDYFNLGDIRKSGIFLRQSLVLNHHDWKVWILMAKLYQLENNKHGFIFALDQAYRQNLGNLDGPGKQIKKLLQEARLSENIQQIQLDIQNQNGVLE